MKDKYCVLKKYKHSIDEISWWCLYIDKYKYTEKQKIWQTLTLGQSRWGVYGGSLCFSQLFYGFAKGLIPLILLFKVMFLQLYPLSSVQLLSRVWVCDPMECSMPGFPVHHQLPELTKTHVHWVSDATQQSHPLSSPSPPAFNLSKHQGLFQWVSSSHQVAKVLEFQLQHQSFQWIFRTDLL